MKTVANRLICGMIAVAFAMPAIGADLIGLYQFEGDYTDTSGAGNNGVLNGTVPFAAGFQGQAATFSANAANYVRSPVDLSQQNNATITWGGWFNTADAAQRIPLGTDNGGWDRIIAINGGNWGVTNGGGFSSTGTAPTLNTWEFVAASHDGSNVSFHLNGNQFSFTENHGTDLANTFVDIGRNPNSAGPWTGLIDNVFFFDNELNDGEIQAIRNLAVEAGTQYHPGEVDQLLDLADGTTSGEVLLDGLVWSISSAPEIGAITTDGGVAVSGDDLFLRLDSTTGGQGLAATPLAVPEPTTIALWALLGLFGFGYWRQSRKRAA